MAVVPMKKVLICGLKRTARAPLSFCSAKGYLKSAMCCRKMICSGKWM